MFNFGTPKKKTPLPGSNLPWSNPPMLSGVAKAPTQEPAPKLTQSVAQAPVPIPDPRQQPWTQPPADAPVIPASGPMGLDVTKEADGEDFGGGLAGPAQNAGSVAMPEGNLTPTFGIGMGPGDAGDPVSVLDKDRPQQDDAIDFQARFDDMWNQTQAQHEAGLQGMLEGTYADEAAAGRRNAEMNALSGGGMGGAFAGGQAQTAIGGMQARLKARNDHMKQGLQMKMTYLQHMLQQAEREKDRDLQEWLQTEADKTLIEIQGMQSSQAEADRNAQKDALDKANAEAAKAALEPNWAEDIGSSASDAAGWLKDHVTFG